MKPKPTTADAADALPESLEDLPPVAVHLKAGRDGILADILLGLRHLGADPQRLHREVCGLLDGLPPENLRETNLEVEVDCDPNLRFAEMHRVLSQLSDGLKSAPRARYWFLPDISAEERDRWHWVSTVRFSLQSPRGKAAPSLQEEHVRVQTQSGEVTEFVLADGSTLTDVRQLAGRLADRAKAAQGSGKRLSVVLHADEQLAVRFWLRLLLGLSDAGVPPGIDGFHLIPGSAKSTVPLSLYGPANGRAFHVGRFPDMNDLGLDK